MTERLQTDKIIMPQPAGMKLVKFIGMLALVLLAWSDILLALTFTARPASRWRS